MLTTPAQVSRLLCLSAPDQWGEHPPTDLGWTASLCSQLSCLITRHLSRGIPGVSRPGAKLRDKNEEANYVQRRGDFQVAALANLCRDRRSEGLDQGNTANGAGI